MKFTGFAALILASTTLSAVATEVCAQADNVADFDITQPRGR